MRAMSRVGAIVAAGLFALLPMRGPAAQPAERPLRLVMNTELQVLDPHVSPSYVTRTFGFMVFDQLVAMDSQGNMRPQMLESWQASEDRLTWTFRLRPGLEWHDGTPVTAEDCIASIRRWGTNDGLGRQMMAAMREMRAIDQNTFVLELARPFSQVIEALGKPSPYVAFMMPARLAAQPPNRPMAEIMGSGPFVFRRDEWRPGDRVVFRRNPRYRPRSEPADGLAGGKVVHFERTEFVSLPDPSMRATALQAGEVDYLEYAPLDYVERYQRDRNLVVMPRPGLSQIMGAMLINNIQPPFNNLAARRALLLAVNQAEVVAGLGLPRDMTMPFCPTIYSCGSPFETDAGAAHLRDWNLDRARAALRESGYNNERVVVLHSADSALISPVTLVLAEQMRRTGFNVDLVSQDFSTLAQRRLSREPVERGGWSIMPVIWAGYDLANPLANYATAYNCSNNYPGWYCDRELTPLLEAFAAEADPTRQREIAQRIQVRVLDNPGIIFAGQFSAPAVHRANLRGVLPGGFPILWNIRREGR